jgi:hypothetical protein
MPFAVVYGTGARRHKRRGLAIHLPNQSTAAFSVLRPRFLPALD